MSDHVLIIAISLGCSAGVCVLGAGLVWVLRRRSLRWGIAVVALVAVGSFVAALMGTAQAMFLSAHDLQVAVWVSVVAGTVSVAFALVVGQLAVRWSRILRDAARDFGTQSSFPAGDRGPAEFDELAAELRRTSDRLNEAQARERRLETSRRELVAWVSHDLRTPLAGLRAMTEALEDEMVADPAAYYTQMRSEVHRMTRMVDDLFELSRIHSGTLQLSLQEVSLGDLVSETVAGASAVARAQGVRLGGRARDEALVTADPAELSRALSNLVINAVRHTPVDGQVVVRVRADEGTAEVSIDDECGGIPVEDLARVFDVAWRGNHARTPTADSGAGLGLAIVQGIVEAHRGTVSVTNLSHGCRFLVRLPV
ncbi:sensor histidine kinase [Janibacter alittae]|uniref:Sensor-like histidine kinase SenX3 n=1 Tax=Janibacter alittae TaxID=3115209 RepID=A0ABZ2MLM6_9MICO